jgi:hypothetical protein
MHALRRVIRQAVCLAGIWLACGAVQAQASYYVLVDADNASPTGCTMTLPTAGSVSGIEYRLSAVVSNATPPQVTQVRLETCSGGVFGAPVDVPGTPYAVGINNGTAAGDVVELAAAAPQIPLMRGRARLYFASQGAAGDDLTIGALINALGATPVPGLGPFGIALLATLVVFLSFRMGSRLKGRPQQILLALSLVWVGTGSLVFAAGYVADGQVVDWSGTSPVVTDPTGDSGPATDIVTGYAAQEGGHWYFRIDLANAEAGGQSANVAPSFIKGSDQFVSDGAGPQTVATWATAISPGPAAEASQQVTFHIVGNTQPSLFTAGPVISANGTQSYTPAVNTAGTATLTINLSDNGGTANGGADTSASQMFTITVNSVNDAPTLSAPATISVQEDVLTPLTGITVADVDAGGGNMTVAFSVPQGALSAVSGGGVTVGGSSSNLNLMGSLANINGFIAAGNLRFLVGRNESAPLITGAQPFSVVAGDLDGDGRPDLVSANRAGNNVTALRNTSSSGAPSFAADLDVSVGTGPKSVAVDDIDGDGKPDLAVANSNNNTSGPSTVSILRSTSTVGSISFDAQLTFPVGANPSYVVLGDLDGDGKPDLVVANSDFSSSNPNLTISVLRNTSTPGSVSFAPGQTFTVGSKPGAVALGDLDGDGKLDLVVANSDNISNVNVNPDTISILRNTSSVGTINFDPQITFATETIPAAVALGDLDGDGKVDVVVGNTNSPNISIFRNTSSPGVISLATRIDVTAGSGHKAIALGDLNGDGKLDIASTASNEAKLAVFFNASTPGSVSLSTPKKADVGQNPFSVAAADLDGDGMLDLATANVTDFSVSIVQNLCQSGCATPVLSPLTSTSLSVTVDDNGNTGSGGAKTAAATVTLNVTPVNDPPVVSLPSGAVTYELSTPVILDGAATVTDVDSTNFSGGNLVADVVGSCDDNDRINVRNQGSSAYQISVSSSTIRYNDGSGTQIIGTLSADNACANGTPSLSVSLNSNATLLAVRALLRNLTYSSAVASPPGNSRTIRITVSDHGTDTSLAADKTVSF